jgi:predicted nucleic acid-binding protein
MAAPFLIDTDVAIDYLRGSVDAIAYIEGLSGNNFISAITVAELYAGV